MREFLDAAARITGRENVLTGKAEIIEFADRAFFGCPHPSLNPPLAAVRPVNLAQAADLLALCRDRKIAMRIRGGGTSPDYFHSDSPWLLMLTGGLNRILDFEPENRLARVQAGVSCASLAKTCAAAGLYFPHGNPGDSLATIGGLVAADSAGGNSPQYGPVANNVLSLEIIAANGARFSCPARNSQAGSLEAAFPLAPIFCGSRGCLGLIGSATLRLVPLPECRRQLRASFGDPAAAARAAAAIAASPLSPAALDILDGFCLELLNTGGASGYPCLYLEFSGSAESASSQLAAARDLLIVHNVQEIVSDAGAASPLAKFPAAFGAARSPWVWQRASVPPSRLPAFVEGAAGIARETHSRIALCGHAAGADLQLAVFYKNGHSAKKALRDLFALELVLNRRMASEADLEKSRGQWQKENGQSTHLSQQIRRIFDPDGILSSSPLPGLEEMC